MAKRHRAKHRRSASCGNLAPVRTQNRRFARAMRNNRIAKACKGRSARSFASCLRSKGRAVARRRGL